MKINWLVKNKNPNLIIFFNGWGMDKNPLKELNWGENDVLMIYDYSTISRLEFLEEYTYKTVLAWSMGVMMAEKILAQSPKLRINRAIAINGTLSPIDKKYGILPKIYDLTLNNFSKSTRDKFFRNMFKNNEIEKIELPKRALESQKKELEFLKKMAQNKETKKLNFDLAIVSVEDKIIPSDNQINFWKEQNIPIYYLNAGHYPFFELEKNFYEKI